MLGGILLIVIAGHEIKNDSKHGDDFHCISNDRRESQKPYNGPDRRGKDDLF